MRQFQYLGTSDDHTSCDCCGKKNLKSTVAIHDVTTGDVLFFGVTCAARALNVQVAEVKNGTRAADEARAEAERAAARAAADAEFAKWSAWLVQQTGGVFAHDGSPNVLEMVKKLGGVAAARSAYQSA